MSNPPPSLTTCYARPPEPCFARVIQIYIRMASHKESSCYSNRLSLGLPLQRGSSIQPSPLSLGRLVRSPYPTPDFIPNIYPSLNESFEFLWLTRAPIIDSWVLSVTVCALRVQYHPVKIFHIPQRCPIVRSRQPVPYR